MKTLYSLLILFVCISIQSISAQEQGEYSYTDAFGPGFYTKNGTPYRSASGKPGPEYWQNRADYTLRARLDEENDRIEGAVQIEYTNNSAEDLTFVWLQLDQNLFRSTSIGQATIPLTSSHHGDAEDEVGIHTQEHATNPLHASHIGDAENQINGSERTSNLHVNNEEPTQQYTADTHMRIDLAEPLSANGGKVAITMDFATPIAADG